MKNPDGLAPTASKGKAKAVKKPASKSKAKKDGDDNADDDDDEDEDEDDAGSASKPQMLLANKCVGRKTDSVYFQQVHMLIYDSGGIWRRVSILLGGGRAKSWMAFGEAIRHLFVSGLG